MGILSDIEQVVSVGFAIGEAMGETLLLRFSQGIDRQLGVLGRAVDDEPHAAA